MAPEGEAPAPVAAPPPELDALTLPIELLPAGTTLHRIHRRSFRGQRIDPISFGQGPGKPPTHRFDAPAGEFGVLYVGLDIEAALIETLLRQPGKNMVDLVDLQIRNAAWLRTGRELRLVQAYGAGLSRLGCSAALSTARYALTGAWSLALWSHRDAPDGLLYRTREKPEQLCAAIFDRPRLAFTLDRSDPLLADPARVARILAAHGKSVAAL